MTSVGRGEAELVALVKLVLILVDAGCAVVAMLELVDAIDAALLVCPADIMLEAAAPPQ